MRILSYSEAINEAFHEIMNYDEYATILGIGVNSPWYVGNTMKGVFDIYGPERVIDIPVSENAVSGIAAGAAITGVRTIVIHPRLDFMYYAMDQIINQAANWSYMFGGAYKVPITLRGIINRGGEQAAQHSQSIHAMFAHAPGIKVVMPATPYDAKGLLISSFIDNNPVLYIDDKWLYETRGFVPEGFYQSEIGKCNILSEGNDITVVASSYYLYVCQEAVKNLKNNGIYVELIDIRSIKPFDSETILNSIKKTGKVVIVDGGWQTCGFASEVSATIADKGFFFLKAPIKRICLPDSPAPASAVLEDVYYPNIETIIFAIKELL